MDDMPIVALVGVIVNIDEKGWLLDSIMLWRDDEHFVDPDLSMGSDQGDPIDKSGSTKCS